MSENHGFIERFRGPATVLAVASVALTGCSRLAGGHDGPATAPGIAHSASPTPGAETAPAGMVDSDDPQLRILADYETALHHEFKLEMYFTDMPRTIEEADSQAEDMAHTLKEYGKYGIRPLIIMEPKDDSGGNISLNTLHKPGYGHMLGALFRGLKERGVSDKEMGTLFPVPEADLPNWGNTHSTDPTLFGKNFTAIGKAFREVFPKGNLGIVLDSTAYPTGDVKFEHGDTSTDNLMPYADALKKPGVPKVNALMFQGFPFVAGSTPSEWLNSGVAEALATKLGAHTIWFNTGTARFIDGHKVSNDVRSELISGELRQAEAAKAAGFIVKINVFAGEDHDPTVLWNYPIRHGAVTPPLPSFMRASAAHGIETALYADQR